MALEATELETWLDYILRRHPASQQVRDPWETYTGPVVAPPLPLEKLLLLAEQNAVHAACLQAKADDAVGRGWQLAPPPDADAPDAPDAAARAALAAQLDALCAPWTFAELLWQAAWELEALGWAAWEVAREGARIAALFPLPAHTLRATTREGQYVQHRDGREVPFRAFGLPGPADQHEVLVFRWYSPRSSYYGLPRWLAAIPALTELTAIREYHLAWFASGGMADRLITVTAPSLDEARQAAQQIEQGLQATRGRGHVSLIVELAREAQVGVQWLGPTGATREGHFLRRRQDLVKEVLMAHGVPPYRIGWAEVGALQGAAAREMLQAYRLGVIEPLQTVLEARLNATLFGPDGLGVRGRWQLADLSWEETELHLRLATEGVAHGLLTPNEGRALLGRPPGDAPALDQYYRQQQLVPLTPEAEVTKALDVVAELRQALAAALEPADG